MGTDIRKVRNYVRTEGRTDRGNTFNAPAIIMAGA